MSCRNDCYGDRAQNHHLDNPVPLTQFKQSRPEHANGLNDRISVWTYNQQKQGFHSFLSGLTAFKVEQRFMSTPPQAKINNEIYASNTQLQI